jgi:hypothetical protein
MPETKKTAKKPIVATEAQSAAAPKKSPKVNTKLKTGRPSTYDPKIARIICEQISEGIPLRQICRENEGFPAWRTVYDWVARDPDLSARLARAREMGYDAIAEEALEISDTPVMGQKQVMGDNKTYVTIEDMLGHRKLQIETRLKLLACWDPKKYGNRTTLAGDAQNPVVIDAAREAKELLEALLLNVELNKQAKINP